MTMTARERRIEDWLCKERELCGRKFLVVRREAEIGRRTDLLVLNAEGELLLIEIKNETSTRAAIGQLFEYVSDFEDATYDDLRAEYQEAARGGEATLDEAFRARFGLDLPEDLPRSRRAILVAPSFDVAAETTALLFRQLVRTVHVTLELVQVFERSPRRFEFAVFEPQPLLRASKIDSLVNVDRRGKVFVTLARKPKPLFCWIGREKDGELRLPGPSFGRTALRQGDRRVRQLPDVVHVGPCELGSVWSRPGNGGREAWVVGAFDARPRNGDRPDRFVFYALVVGGQFRSWRKKAYGVFSARWIISDRRADWSQVADQVTAKEQA